MYHISIDTSHLTEKQSKETFDALKKAGGTPNTAGGYFNVYLSVEQLKVIRPNLVEHVFRFRTIPGTIETYKEFYCR